MPRVRTRGIACLLSVLATAAPGFADDASPRWVELAEGVFAVLQPEPLRFSDSNSFVVHAPETAQRPSSVLVVDAQANATFVRQVVDDVRERFAPESVTLVNTHWHGDHTQGNATYRRAFGDALAIVAHATVADDLVQRARPQHEDDMERLAEAIDRAVTRLDEGVAEDGASMTPEQREDLAGRIERARERLATGRRQEWVPPTRGISAPDTFRLGTRRVVLLPFRAHTRGDVVLFLPEDGILVTGDLLDDLPYGGHGYPAAWIETLRELEALDFDTVVPGHGRIRHGKEHMQLVRAMLEDIVAQTKQLVAEGRTLEETQSAIRLDSFRDALVTDDVAERVFHDFVSATIERAYLEARGELPRER